MIRLLPALLLLLGLAAPASAQRTLEAARARGAVACGVNGALPGFSAPDAQGVMRGFDADWCRAVAAAALGDAARVRFVPMQTVEQGLAALRNGEVDLLARNATFTFGRDAGTPVLPTAVVLFDGMGFLVPVRLGVSSPRELGGRTVCWAGAAGPGTAGDNLDAFAERQRLSWTIRRLEDSAALVAALEGGQCDAISADASALAVARAVRVARPGDYALLAEVISSEPLTPYVRTNDEVWRGLVFWTIQALIQAEVDGITSANLMENLGHPDPRVRRLLGVTGNLGEALGLPNEWAARAIMAVGNYGEIFARNLGHESPIGMERGLNATWRAGGLLVPMPLR